MQQIVRYRPLWIDYYGKEKLSKMRKVMPGEDFAWYLQDKPGCFAFIGIQNPEVGATFDHHNNDETYKYIHKYLSYNNSCIIYL